MGLPGPFERAQGGAEQLRVNGDDLITVPQAPEQAFWRRREAE